MCDPTAPRRRGPQARAARNDRAVLEAAHHVFLTQGVDAPVSAVAERAGVGMGSLYRRYRTKEELLQRLGVDSMESVAGAAEEAMAVADPWQAVADYVWRCVERGLGVLAPLASTVEATEEMRRASERARQATEALVSRAQTAGVLRADVSAFDLTLLISHFRCPPEGVADPHLAQRRLLAIALDGLRAPAGSGINATLPGAPPEPGDFQSAWNNHCVAPEAGGSTHGACG
ncbi:TetR/AcrR family transcriptional regulator [Spiractinospora alimapuensis]|uniref:TetR/AcrR family transcriptional regulator n=1 Tax=Spiractinospora alimapuensis TaxID=2820884 RepID=UPI001F2448DD|nr:TetR/AcrR family transcriptional regulator [Spiractinospora alimapuensis]QVQ52837.1 TetR/AcrR family transcriptional regulator [Spiractinospora alimapuensis]